MRLRGGLTVARLEFLLRIRAGRWRWLLGSWFAVLLAITILVRAALADTLSTETADSRGAVMFGVVMLLVLSLALLVAPALSAQSINGDRERGTLATLQVTRLRPAEIAVGKLAAAWATAATFLAVTLPLAIWCYAEGGLSVLRVLGVYLVMTLLLGIVAAIALALSALLPRTTTSALLAYVSVFALTVGTFVAFGLATALIQQDRTVSMRVCRFDRPTDCQTQSYTETVARPDRTWWLFAPNPIAILADSAPATPTRLVPDENGRLVERPLDADPLGTMSRAMHRIRVAPEQTDGGFEVPAGATGAAVWPTGLAVDLLLAAGAVVVTIRRLRTPTRRLAVGQRIA